MSRWSIPGALAAVIVLGLAGAMLPRAARFAIGGEVQSRPLVPPSGEKTVIKVPSGLDGGVIAQQMERAGVIAGAEQFRTVAALMGVQNELSAGDYEFTRGMAVTDVIQRLRKGFVLPTITVTIPEGRRIEEVAAIFEQRGLTSAADFVAAAAAADYPQPFLQERPPGATLEGYLFPDTYFFVKNLTARDLVVRLLGTFDQRFSQALRQAARANNLTVHQAVTLASIVEREAQVAEERPVIAAVFINRLKAGMPLQADPTVQYAITTPASVAEHGWWKRELTVDDLQSKSPYSTYANAGLPPGPIASAGLSALQAVAQPATVKYLYFAAKGDGSHAFAETLEEHNRNVRRYLR